MKRALKYRVARKKCGAKNAKLDFHSTFSVPSVYFCFILLSVHCSAFPCAHFTSHSMTTLILFSCAILGTHYHGAQKKRRNIYRENWSVADILDLCIAVEFVFVNSFNPIVFFPP